MATMPAGVLPGYFFTRKLGSGAFGTVYEVRREADGNLFAAKVIDLSVVSDEESTSILGEVIILKTLHHPGVLRFFSYYFNTAERVLTILTELCPGGDLEKYVAQLPGQRLQPSVAVVIARALLIAIRYLNLEGVMHRDVKVLNWYICLNPLCCLSHNPLHICLNLLHCMSHIPPSSSIA